MKSFQCKFSDLKRGSEFTFRGVKFIKTSLTLYKPMFGHGYEATYANAVFDSGVLKGKPIHFEAGYLVGFIAIL